MFVDLEKLPGLMIVVGLVGLVALTLMVPFFASKPGLLEIGYGVWGGVITSGVGLQAMLGARRDRRNGDKDGK